MTDTAAPTYTPLTDEMIRDMRREAGDAGDTVAVAICDVALCGTSWDGGPEARRKVAAMITDARAADVDGVFVRVEEAE